MNKPHGRGHRLLMLMLILLLAGTVFFLGVVGHVCWQEQHVPKNEPYDAIIVLGAQVKADGTLSVQLQWRLDAAYDAWEGSPCLVVTCGAQGADEPAPEGQVMREYLIGRGIPEWQVLADTDSYNTRQNIENAAALLRDYPVERVLIVTSDYHLPRALALARDQGLTASGIGSTTLPEYWIKNHFREALSWIKYWGQKYLRLPLD